MLKELKKYLLRGITAGILGLSQLQAAESGYMADQFRQVLEPASFVNRKESGLALDIARHFYPVDVIKDFIDTIHNAGGTFLHLHFSDHENYALESAILNQRAEDANADENGVYINPKTRKPFLTFAQLKEITDYAKSKNIELIPELDSPNHMTAIFDLLAEERGKDYVQQIRSKWTEEEIDINNPESIEFIKSLIAEVIWIFGDSSKHFHIGGDEFGYGVDNNHEFIAYANTLSAFLSEKGLKTRIWNDGLIKATIEQLNPDIQITYWSYDGDPGDEREARQRRQIRLSMPELIERGFTVLNYNSYYLYLNPREGASTSHDSDFAMKDVLQNWELGIWDNRNRQNKVKNSDKILGSALSIWGENAGSLNSDTIQKYSAGLLTSVIYKTNATSDLSGTALKLLGTLAENDFSALNFKTYVDLTQVKNNALIDLEKNRQVIQFLQENKLREGKGLTFWLQGENNNTVILSSNWQKTDAVKNKNGKHYQAYEYLNNKIWIDRDISISMR